MRASRSAEQGVGQVPVRPVRPGDRHFGDAVAGSAVGVARTAAVAAGEAALLPARQVRAPGRRSRSRSRAPSSSLRRRTMVGASSLSWVAQAVESVRTTSRSSAKRLGRAVRGDLVADQLGPAAEDRLHAQVELPAVVGDEPAQAVVRAAAGRGRRGGRPTSGDRRGGAGRRTASCACASARGWPGTAPAARRGGAGQVEAVVAVLGPARAPGRCRRLVARAVVGLVTRHGVPPRRRRRTGRPAARRARRRRPPR